MQRNFAIAAGAILSLASMTAAAQALDIKTGLWEGTMQEASTRPPPINADEITKGMTPEQRARVEATLKRQAEQRKAEGDGPETKTMVKRFCITPKQLEGDPMGLDDKELAGDREEKCTRRIVTQTPSRVLVRTECAAGSRAKGELGYEAKSRESFSASYTMDATVQGKPFHRQFTTSARWLGPDCGKVK